MSLGALGVVTEREVGVRMRDGVVLRANVFRPDGEGAYPGLLLRTPYGKPVGGMERYVRAGYVVVTQDTRGRYASEGEYVPFTVEHTGDAEDGYDSVEWLAAQPYCDGRVGTFGASYNAWMQWQLAKLRPPHLKAMCAYTIPLELRDIDFPGAFRPGRRIKWWMTTMAPDLRRRHGLPPPHRPAEADHIWQEVEQGRWLHFLPWREIVRYLPPGLAQYADEWLRRPAQRVWKFDEAHREIEVPNLDFSGWYDHCGGTMRHLALMQRNARTEVARTQTRLVIGPWNHGGLGQRKIGEVDFGPQAELNLQDVIIRWFDRWLKGIENGVEREPAVRYFVMGSGEWKAAETWPPMEAATRTYYLHSNGDARGVSGGGVLRVEEPVDSAADGYDSYAYDPRDALPTLWPRTLFTTPADRRQLEHRTDVLYYRSAPLEHEVEMVGYPEVVLHVASSARDTDFFAWLVDEHPDGRALDVCSGMVRARHRNGLEHEELLEPGEVTELRIAMGATAVRFLRGHRIRLEISSSDFPNYDRNHNTGGDDLGEVRMEVAEQSVWHTPRYASRLVVPVMES